MIRASRIERALAFILIILDLIMFSEEMTAAVFFTFRKNLKRCVRQHDY